MRIESRRSAVETAKRPPPKAIVAVLVLLQLCRASAGNSYSSSAKRSALSEFRNNEVAVPRIYNRNRTLNVTAFEGVKLPGIIVVEFSAFQQFFSIQLIRNKYFISDNYTEKSVKDSGEVYHDTQKDFNCYYTGHLVGKPNFKAVFSACSGLRGYVRTDADDYHLEPSNSSPSGRHYVFRASDYSGLNISCGLKDRNLNDRIGRSIDKIAEQNLNSGSWTYDNKTRFIELYMVADYAELAAFRGNTTDVFRRMKEIVNIVNFLRLAVPHSLIPGMTGMTWSFADGFELYRPMNILVTLVGTEVWEKDRMEVSVAVDKTLTNFLEYRRLQISNKHRNDNAQLITGRIFSESKSGMAHIMTMCTSQFSGGVTSDYTALAGPVASALAHELGHNLGLFHDTKMCQCPDDQCIMSIVSGGPSVTMAWSECSKLHLSDAFHQGLDYCLFDEPPVTPGDAVCGNGVTEDGEDCDCGFPQDCDNHCCNAASCTVMPNATCAFGGCCDLLTCQLQPVTTECRVSDGDCDLSEYCDGVSPICPSDIFSADGSQCSVSGVNSFCYRGKCNTRDTQCTLLWGITGRPSHSLCFEQYNVLGNGSGNCGADWVNGKPLFRKCEPQDAPCGMLHCQHLNEKLMFWKESLAYGLPESSVIDDYGARQECKGAILDVGMDMPDPGMVPDGAACGKEKACFNKQCLNVRTAFPDMCPDCHGHGVCNSIGQCHCDVGYSPPFCGVSGNGGSLHSGPIKIHPAEDNSSPLTAGLCVFFFLILPLLILLGYCIFKHRRRMKYCWFRRRPEMYSSAENVNICKADSFDASLPETQSNEVDLVSKVEEVDVLPSVPVSVPKTKSATLPPGPPPPLSRPLSSVVMRPPSSPPPQPTRASSITTQDISGPQFVSSTNVNLDSTLPLSGIKRGEFRGSGQRDNPEQRPGNEFHSMTLPNLKSRPRGISSDARVVGVRGGRLDDVMSEVCFGEPPGGGGSVGFRRPQQSNPKGLQDEENVYEEINSMPVCPKIPPPDPPNSQKKSAGRNLRGLESQARNSSGSGGTSPANLPAPGNNDKMKMRSSEKAGVRSTTGASDSKEHRVPRRPRQNTGRSSSIQSSSAAGDNTPAASSSNSDLKGARKPREQTRR